MGFVICSIEGQTASDPSFMLACARGHLEFNLMSEFIYEKRYRSESQRYSLRIHVPNRFH
jgi:hypothetical protein